MKHHYILHVYYNKYSAVMEILKHSNDIDINVMDRNGDTPLCIVCQSDDCNRYDINIIKILLEQSSIIINKSNRSDGRTPFDMIQYKLSIQYNDDRKQYWMKILHLFEEYYIKQRWLQYCYYIK